MLKHQNEKPLKPSRVVVIGAGGFVGSSIAKMLEAEQIPVYRVTRKEIDLLSNDANHKLKELLQPQDSVVITSALAPTKTVTMLMQNLKMAEALCQALGETPVQHVVYISSDAVYADTENPVTEESVCQPSSLHGMMHAARELMFKSTIKSPLAILRPSLIYGAADPHNGYGPNRFRRLAAKGEAISLFGNGEEKRDHVFIDDVAKIALLTLLHRSTGILNIATGHSSSFREVAEMVVADAKSSSAVQGTARQNPITHRHFNIVNNLKAFPTFHYTPLNKGLQIAREGM